MSRPLIGIATQTQEAIPGKLPACWIMGQRYARVLASLEGLPWFIPLLPHDEATLRAIYERLDAVFLTGGVDVDPTTYGEERHALCDKADPARDWTEFTLIRWAIADRKPLFGVCRGIQAINVACGGSLYQHVPEQYPGTVKHDCFPSNPVYTRDYLAHSVSVQAGSRLARLVQTSEVVVNSMHHQGIKLLAPGLSISAQAPDGLIEGVEMTEAGYLMGVQWHPEELTDAHPTQRRLFTDFIEAAGAYRSR